MIFFRRQQDLPFGRVREGLNFGPANAPVVFLDLDGVMNATFDHRGYGSGAVEHEFVTRLNRITAATGATVVLSTGWRQHRSFGALSTQLRAAGVEAEVTGRTPVLDIEWGDRWHEVRAWLRTFGARPYVILDDIDYFGPLSLHHVWTEPDQGLQDDDVELAIFILRGKHTASR